MLDPHKFPKAHKADEGRSSESRAGDPAALPASQVNVSAVDNTPHTKTDTEPKPRRSTGLSMLMWRGTAAWLRGGLLDLFLASGWDLTTSS